MKLYLSTISALSGFQFFFGLLTGIWPSCAKLMQKAEVLGTKGLQLSILKGWKVGVIQPHLNSIPVIEGVWGNQGFIEKQLFDKDATSTLWELHAKATSSKKTIYTVDVKDAKGNFDLTTLIELADLPDRYPFAASLLIGSNPDSIGIVYDTWHAREILHFNCRQDWAPPEWYHLLGIEVMKNKQYYEDYLTQHDINHYLLKDFEKFAPYIKVFQIQTRSKQEAMRFMAWDATMLEVQISLIASHFQKMPKELRGVIPVVIEIPPWWSTSFKKDFIDSVEERFSTIF